MAKPYVLTITATTTAGSTTLPEGLNLVSITHTDATNFVTLSFEAAIGTSGNPEGAVLAGEKVDFSNLNKVLQADTLYWQADTANVAVTLIGYIA